ncbi:MAG TPA: hypothetical protein ENH82_10490 [bacterium]|nr:hypothetical protein [bacterium]
MPDIYTLKDNLINELWLPTVKDARKLLYPRRRNNAKMKLLTLTNGINVNEINRFEECGLIQREDAVAWIIDDFNKRMRLEAEAPGVILEGDIFLESILDPTSQIRDHFPFDILNLDFSSQEPILLDKRIECEVGCMEKILYLQNENNVRRLVLFYTTTINSHCIERDVIIEVSDAVQVDGWQGLTLSNFPSNISELVAQKSFLQSVLQALCQKYGYPNIQLTDLALNTTSNSIQLYSIAVIVER